MTLRPTPASWFELVTTRDELAPVLDVLARSGAVELETMSRPTAVLIEPRIKEALTEFEDLQKRYAPHWPPASGKPAEEIGSPDEIVDQSLTALKAWVHEAEPLIADLEHADERMRQLERLNGLLSAPGVALPDLSLLGQMGTTVTTRLELLPTDTKIEALPATVMSQRYQRPNGDYLLLMGPAQDVASLEPLLQTHKAVPVVIPDDLPASPEAAAAILAARAEELRKTSAANHNQLSELNQSHAIAAVRHRLELMAWLVHHAENLTASERLAWVTGWTTATDPQDFCGPLAHEGMRCLVEFKSAPEGATPPSLLHNPPWARAFEFITKLLGSPGEDETDPSIVVALFAPVLFGFMFGDVGHGAVLLLAGLALRKRVPLLAMLVPGGAMAMLFGLLYGDVFAREDILPALWLRPLHEPITLIIAALAIGIVILATGQLLNAAQAHWRKEGVNWWLRDAGLLLAYIAVPASFLMREAVWAALAGVIWFVLGCVIVKRATPLSALAESAGHLIESALQLFVNTVSFARVGAFALAHAGLSLAVTEVAEAAGAIGYWVVLILGNILILLLEGLIVSIQTTRLLLFEFFIRFLRGGGRSFKALRPPGLQESA